jgi:hypothetical protein
MGGKDMDKKNGTGTAKKLPAKDADYVRSRLLMTSTS